MAGLLHGKDERLTLDNSMQNAFVSSVSLRKLLHNLSFVILDIVLSDATRFVESLLQQLAKSRKCATSLIASELPKGNATGLIHMHDFQ
jgi:hypothetical protein